MTSMQYNGLTETREYNVLGRLTGIRYSGPLRHEHCYLATANDSSRRMGTGSSGDDMAGEAGGGDLEPGAQVVSSGPIEVGYEEGLEWSRRGQL
jgi:hypothetical protein